MVDKNVFEMTIALAVTTYTWSDKDHRRDIGLDPRARLDHLMKCCRQSPQAQAIHAMLTQGQRIQSHDGMTVE